MTMSTDQRPEDVRLAEARQAGIRCGQYALYHADLAVLLAALGLDVVLGGREL